MQYLSTRGNIAPIGFTQAVLMGLAEDGGLLLPRTIPRIGIDTFNACSVAVTLQVKDVENRSSKRSLTVVNVTDGTYVHVRL